MAHELDTRDNGVHSFVSLLKTAWHKLGTVVGDWLSVEETITLGGLAIPYQLVPTFYEVKGGAQDGERLPSGHAAIIRTDRQEVMGNASPGYSLSSHLDMFTPEIRALLDMGLARIETAGVIKGGRVMWLLLQVATPTDEGAHFQDADRLAQYIRVRLDFTGGGSNLVETNSVRVVCANTDAMAGRAGSNTIRIAHRGNVAERVREAALVVHQKALENWRDSGAAYNALRKVKLSDAQFAALVLDVVLPLTSVEAGESKSKATRRDAVEMKREELTRLWLNGIGHQGDRSAAEALQAVTQAADWSPDLFNSRKAASWDQADALDSGNLVKVKRAASASLLALV